MLFSLGTVQSSVQNLLFPQETFCANTVLRTIIASPLRMQGGKVGYLHATPCRGQHGFKHFVSLWMHGRANKASVRQGFVTPIQHWHHPAML